MNLDFTVKPEPAKTLNMQTFQDYYSRLRLLALSIFEWQGLPESISIRYLEQSLFEQGRVFFFEDKKMGHLCLRGGPDSALNVYGDPLKVRVFGANGYNRELDPGQYVMIRNNLDTRPTEPTIRLYAQRMSQAERSLDVNIAAQRTPMLLICEEKQRLTLKNVYAQYSGNEPVIFADKSMNPDMIKSIKTDAVYVGDKLMLYKRDLWNECLTFLGINNANTDKKERLITDEVQANDQMISLSAQVMLLTRQQAAAEISKLFGIQVTVQPREVPETDPVEQEPETKEEEATDNG
jgi:hypothetical protein